MIGEILQHQNGEDQAKALTEPFMHYLGSDDEGTDQVICITYTSGPSAGALDVIPVDHLVLYWRLPHYPEEI